MKHILLTTTLALGLAMTSSLAHADYAAERAYLEKEIDRVCSVSIGAGYNSAAYFDCRSYYDRRFYDYGYDWNRLTAEQVSEFLNIIHPFIDRCRNQGLVSTLLWGCIRDYGDGHYRDWANHHPGFKPNHEYRPHFEKGPAPKREVAPQPPRSERAKGPHPDKGPQGKKENPRPDNGPKDHGPDGMDRPEQQRARR